LINREGDPHSRLKAIACLGVILQVIFLLLLTYQFIFRYLIFFNKGPFEVGSAIIVKNNLLMLMLELADSDDMIQEVIVLPIYKDLMQYFRKLKFSKESSY
jgi:hypothetical protein